jgi:hypothetical protein
VRHIIRLCKLLRPGFLGITLTAILLHFVVTPTTVPNIEFAVGLSGLLISFMKEKERAVE